MHGGLDKARTTFTISASCQERSNINQSHRTMKKHLPHVLAFIIFLFFISHVGYAKKYKGNANKSSANPELKQNAAGCAAASGFRYLNINNVRTRINTGGDMWWDLNNPKMYIAEISLEKDGILIDAVSFPQQGPAQVYCSRYCFGEQL